MEVNGKLHDLSTLFWGMRPFYPLKNRMGGPQRYFECSAEEKNPFLLPNRSWWEVGHKNTKKSMAHFIHHNAIHNLLLYLSLLEVC
jgi:hypothetical protein